MKLSEIKNGNLSAEWAEKGYELPKFDIEAVKAKTHAEPTWVHFGAGNIFRAFPAAILNDALNTGKYDRGVIVAESFDYEIIDTSGGLIGWANLFGDVLHQTITGKAQQSPLSTNSTVDQVQGVSAEITLERPVLAQVDGDMLPETKHIRFSVERQALCVRVPEAASEDTGILALNANMSATPTKPQPTEQASGQPAEQSND